jgi:hypothetical protein
MFIGRPYESTTVVIIALAILTATLNGGIHVNINRKP